MTTTEDNLQVGDVFRPRPNKNNGFMTMIVIKEEENGLITVKRPFCYGKERDYEISVEIFSFWKNKNFEIDILERRK